MSAESNDSSMIETDDRSTPSVVTIRLPEQKENLKEATGPHGLATLKAYDHRFSFVPRFSIERNLLLDYRAKEIHLLGKTIRDVLGTTGGVEAQAQAVRDGATMTLDDLMLNLEEKLALFDAAAWNATTANNAKSPDRSSLKDLQYWLYSCSINQQDVYDDRAVMEYRMITPPPGPVKRLVKVTMPTSRLGRFLLRSFKPTSPQASNLVLCCYDDTVLLPIAEILLLLVICTFLIVPLALLAYFDANHTVRTVLVLAMCFLISILARAFEADEARQLLLVCAYSAIMSGFLSQGP